MLLSGQGGRWGPGIWEEQALCSDLFVLLLCCLMSSISVNQLKSKKFVSSLFVPLVLIFLKDQGMFFLPALACA